MLTTNQLCAKIRSMYPDVGECGMGIDVTYDSEEQSTIVYLCKGNKTVKHFLSDEDVEACMAGRRCLALGIEIAQLRDERYL